MKKWYLIGCVIVCIFIVAMTGCEKNQDEVKNDTTTVMDIESENRDHETEEEIEKSVPIEEGSTVDQQRDDSKDEKVSEGQDRATIESDWKRPGLTLEVLEGEGVPDHIPAVYEESINDLESLYNWGQYRGFTDNQKALLLENGFVVTQWPNDSNQSTSLHADYEYAEYMDLPIFVTTDIALHMYRTYYSESMKTLEILEYYPDLLKLNNQLLEACREFYEAYPGEELSLKLYGQHGVAAVLLNNDPGLMDTMPKEVVELINRELELIEDEQYMDSPIYDMKLDYSQFKVRGHYTLSDELSNYFKGMMWYGLAGFPLMDEDHIDTLNMRIAMINTHMLFNDISNISYWDKIYELTALYSSATDDVTPYDIRDLMLDVYGEESLNYAAYLDTSYEEAINERAKALPRPQIVAKLSNEDDRENQQLLFKWMGQRYTLDSEILQDLMEPILRPMPTAYDVLSAMNHKVAEEILRANYPTSDAWPKYDGVLDEWKDKIASMDSDFYERDLYHGWLKAIDLAADDFQDVEGMPSFMRSKAYALKALNSALGSYAFLKHDNILYSKQAMAEMGGEFLEYQEFHYVEPNVALYQQLLNLTQRTKTMLEEQEIDERFITPLTSMEKYMRTFRDVSIKELTGEQVTDEEFNLISGLGGYIDYLKYSFNYDLNEAGVDIDPAREDAIVGDVATVLGMGYLEEANGRPMNIYVICQVNGKTFLAKGITFSYYEFVSNERLTDAQWLAKLGYSDLNEYGYYEAFQNSYDFLEVMPWNRAYVSSDPDYIYTESMPLMWGNE